MEQAYTFYREQLRKIADINGAIAVLSWDKEVNMPPKGAAFRAQQVATLTGMVHELVAAPEFIEKVNALHEQPNGLNQEQRKNIHRSHHLLQRLLKLDKAFVIRRSRMVSEGYHAWLAARKANDFQVFRPALEKLVAIKREETERIGYPHHPYEALLDEFEPGCTVPFLDELFDKTKAYLSPILLKIQEQEGPDDRFLFQHFPRQEQWEFGLELLRSIGYDFEAGRQDLSAHPFTINFSAEDVRVTTRVDEQNFATMTWSCLHEGGHALYEQGLPSDQYGLPLGSFVSLGIHESQSRLWENHVGRSREFWQAHYPKLQARFPEQFRGVQLDQFYAGINKVKPTFIRVEADELQYHLHVLVRYELEKALIEQNLEVQDLEQAWNEKYARYLGLTVPDANQGVLQDIHWAHGSLGYFPTYSLGSFYAAQFFRQAQRDIPELKVQLVAGDGSQLLKWLREKIHHWGQFYTAEELCVAITGRALDFDAFQRYVDEKFGALYNF